jgi:hypothetical protein
MLFFDCFQGIGVVKKYRPAKFSDLALQMTANNPFPVDASTEFALWDWSTRGLLRNDKTHQTSQINEKISRAQILSPDGALYLLPNETRLNSICRF